MSGVVLAGVSIAAATVLGMIPGCMLDRVHPRTYAVISSIAAGVMLCAAIHGLVIPAIEQSGNVLVICLGIGLGAWFLCKMNRVAPFFLKRMNLQDGSHQVRNLMFVLAIAIHHFPEGLAAGVSFGVGEAAETAAVCSAIAIQNIPEAMMVMPAMTQVGAGRMKAFAAAAISGGVEIMGLVVGYCAVQLTVTLLPLMLALAAGAMLFVILENMLPEAREQEQEVIGTYSVLMGYCMMIFVSTILEQIL